MRSFWKDRSGNFGLLTALAATPLILGVGIAVDGSRYYAAHSHLQNVADAMSLALAATQEKDQEDLKILANGYLAANVSSRTVAGARISSFVSDEEQIDVGLSGSIPATFMKLGGFEILEVGASSLAKRAPTRQVEVSLVLDNTWSMSEKDTNGIARIETLKQASRELIDELFIDDGDGTIKMGIVPYADYVNVGTSYRSAGWLNVPADEPAVAATCESVTVTSEEYCAEYGPYYSHTTSVDGVEETGQRRDCLRKETRQIPPKTKQQCSGGKAARIWHGCVGSRMSGTSRLHDLYSDRYPGFIDSSQKCLNPLVPLTTDKDTLLGAINGLIINIGGYKPFTYIPAGLIWGVNILSPTEPFAQGLAYDANNEDPRKVLILMTDGDNTRRFNASNGQHVVLSAKPNDANTQIAQTNADTEALCTYAKSNKIEIYTVAFMVENAIARQLLEACATDEAHYYDASDREKLLTAFSGIARAINQVRLAR